MAGRAEPDRAGRTIVKGSVPCQCLGGRRPYSRPCDGGQPTKISVLGHARWHRGSATPSRRSSVPRKATADGPSIRWRSGAAWVPRRTACFCGVRAVWRELGGCDGALRHAGRRPVEPRHLPARARIAWRASPSRSPAKAAFHQFHGGVATNSPIRPSSIGSIDGPAQYKRSPRLRIRSRAARRRLYDLASATLP